VKIAKRAMWHGTHCLRASRVHRWGTPVCDEPAGLTRAVCLNQIMRTGSRFADEQLLRRLLAPSDLEDGVEALGYWRARSRRLRCYRLGARREAARMTVRWEQRVGAALVAQRGAPLASRLSAGLLVAQTRLGRWTRRARIALVATVTVGAVLVAVPTAAALVLLLHAL